MRLHLLFVLMDALMLIAIPLVFVAGKLRQLCRESSIDDNTLLRVDAHRSRGQRHTRSQYES